MGKATATPTKDHTKDSPQALSRVFCMTVTLLIQKLFTDMFEAYIHIEGSISHQQRQSASAHFKDVSPLGPPVKAAWRRSTIH